MNVGALTRRIVLRVHGWLGLSAGAVLALIGLSGACLSFEDELIAALNAPVLQVAPRERAPLDAAALAAAFHAQRPQARLQMLTLYADPRRSARLMLGPTGGARRGEVWFADPYDGRLLGDEASLRGHGFLELMENLHRRLALGPPGRSITGACVVALLAMLLSGMYLRWPRRWWSPRRWLLLDKRWHGRARWWNLHAVAGAVLLPCYLLSATTGLSWSYEGYRAVLYRLAGETPPPKPDAGSRSGARGNALPPQDFTRLAARLAQAQQLFAQNVSEPVAQLSFSVPQRDEEPMQLTYLRRAAPHGRAVNRLRIDRENRVLDGQRYDDKTLPARLLASVFPLHAGTYFGRIGQIGMMLASLAMPVFFGTGVWLYWSRRQRRAAAAVASS